MPAAHRRSPHRMGAMPAATSALSCPRCTAPMRPLRLSSHRHESVTVDHCPDCRMVWFEQLESVQLDALGWVRLLRKMEAGAGRPLAPAQVGRPACPSCAQPLKPVQNRTRFGRFAVLECPERHGHEHTRQHGERPAGGDDDPAAVVAFGLFQDDIGDNAVTQQDEQHGADKFSEIGRHNDTDSGVFLNSVQDIKIRINPDWVTALLFQDSRG